MVTGCPAQTEERRIHVMAVALVLMINFLLPAAGNLGTSPNNLASMTNAGSSELSTEVSNIAGNPLRDFESETTPGSHQTIAPWPMHLNNPAHTSYIETPAPSTDILFWSNVTGKTYSSPSVADGLVFIGSRGVSGDHMNAFYVENGTLAWRMTTYERVSGGEGVPSSPAYWNGHVYFGADRIYCLYANNGTVKWTVETGNTNYGDGTPTVANGKVFIGASDWRLYCIDALTGEIIWAFETGKTGAYNYGPLSAPAVANNLVYVGAADGYVYQINETQPGPNATASHTFYVADYIYSSAVVANDRVYFGMGHYHIPNENNRFFVLDATDLGLIWEFYPGTSTAFFSSAAVAYGNVYFASVHGELYALDALADSPIVKWNYSIGESWSSPAIADDKLYVGSKTGYIYAFDAIQAGTPTYLWRRSLGGDVDSSPAISDGVVYIGTHGGGGSIYALGELGDFDPPTISDVTIVPDPQEIHESVNVSAVIHDASGIEEALLNVTDPESMQVSSFTMLYDSSSGRYYYEHIYDIPGTHDFLVFARDKAGNWNTTSGAFTIVDTTPPSISGVEAIPNPQEVFNPVNISADVADNVQIATVTAEVLDPTSALLGNFTMEYDPLSGKYFNEVVGDSVGTYTFTIWASDSSGNVASSAGSFTLEDWTSPTIAQVTASPDPQEIPGNVNITAHVDDNHVLSGIWVEIFDPSSSPAGNFSMNYDSLSARYYYEDPYGVLGIWSFTISASDVNGNWDTASGSFLIQDTTAPSIEFVTAIPDPQTIDGFVNISAKVFDNYELLSVDVNVTDPDGTVVYDGPMDFNSMTGRHYRNYSYHKIGNYTFVIEANDSEGNTRQKGGGFSIGFSPQDSQPPTIWEVAADPDPQEVFESVNVSAVVTDNWGVRSVRVHVYDPSSTSLGNFSMVLDVSTGRYSYDSAYSMLGHYTFIVWANDTSGNENSTIGGFTMVDTIGPEIHDVTAVPDPQETGGIVNISALVVDSVCVDCAWIELLNPLNISLGTFPTLFDPGTGRFFYTSTFSELGQYRFILSANDTSGNSNSTWGVFRIADTTVPQITDAKVEPDAQEIFGTSRVSARVKDDYALEGVWVNVTDPLGEGAGNFTMTFVDDVHYYDQTCDLLGSYQFRIWAVDSSGNWNSASVQLQCIDSTRPIVEAVAVPSPQEVHGEVNISAEVTENHQLAGIWVEIHDPDDMLLGNFSMSFDPSQGKYFYLGDYSELGTYNFVVSAVDTSDNWGSETGTFEMQDSALPRAEAGADRSILEGNIVTFDASASTDNFGISSYEWSFNDGTEDIVLGGITAQHTFLKTGDFHVQLEVRDYSDNSAKDWLWVYVDRRPAPNPPENLSVSEFGLDYITLTWDPPTTNEDGSPLTDIVGYHFYRSLTQGGPYARLTGEPLTETTLTDVYLHPGFRAYYVLTAVNSYGYESVHSNEVLGQTVSKGSIEGKVVDDDAEPVALALVELLGDGEVVLLSTYTNSTGGYRLEDLDSGEYTIRAVKEGYHDASVVVDVDYGDVMLPEPLVLKKIDEAGFIPIWIYIIPVVVAALTAITILLLKRRRAKETGISEETDSSPDEV